MKTPTGLLLRSWGTSSLLCLALCACSCQSESEAAPKRVADAPKAEASPVAASRGAPASPATAETADAAPRLPQTRLPLGVAPGRVGFSVRLNDEHFMIWGGLPAGQMPKGLAVSPDGTRVFCSNMGVPGEMTLSVYHATPFRLERHLDVPGNAIEVLATEREVFVTNSIAWGKLQVFSPDGLRLEREIAVPGFPKWMVRDPESGALYVSLWQLDGISRVSWPEGTVETVRTRSGTRVRDASKNKHPRGSVLTRDGKTLYVANNADESLSLVDTASFSERSRIRVGYAPRHVVRAEHTDSIFVSLTGNDSVLELDTVLEKPVREIAVGKRPKTIASSHDGRYLYAANYIDNSLSIVDLERGERVDLPLDVHKVSGLAVRPDDRFIYVTGFCTHDVWAIERVKRSRGPTLPLGPDHDNRPCFDCPSSFEGCPYYGGPVPLD